LSDTDLTLPHFVYVALTTPFFRTDHTTVPAPYCGQKYPAASTSAYYCYFNAAGQTFVLKTRLCTNRALAVPATGTTGLNYASPNCTLSGATNCQIYDSFSQGGVFNVLKFNITAKDPYKTTAAVPTYTTLSVGASPVLVLVSNKDTSVWARPIPTATAELRIVQRHSASKLSFIFQGNSSARGPSARRPAGFDHHHPTRRRIRIRSRIAGNPPRTVVRNL